MEFVSFVWTLSNLLITNYWVHIINQTSTNWLQSLYKKNELKCFPKNECIGLQLILEKYQNCGGIGCLPKSHHFRSATKIPTIHFEALLILPPIKKCSKTSFLTIGQAIISPPQRRFTLFNEELPSLPRLLHLELFYVGEISYAKAFRFI